MVPGLDAKALAGAKIDEKAMAHTEAIILSMTPAERENPSILNSSRKRRIAAGAGCCEAMEAVAVELACSYGRVRNCYNQTFKRKP